MHELHRVTLNNGRVLAAYFQSYRGEMKAHIRYVRVLKKSGETRYNGSGVAVPLEELDEFLLLAATLVTARKQHEDGK